MSHYKIRTAAKALIIKNSQILLTKHEREFVYYTLPGGGQQHNEALNDTLKRECFEELGAHVTVGDTAFIYEYIGDNHQFSKQDKGFHQIDIVFDCLIESDFNLEMACELDDTQIGCEWINIADLPDVVMYPMAFREQICNYVEKQETRTYLGDIG